MIRHSCSSKEVGRWSTGLALLLLLLTSAVAQSAADEPATAPTSGTINGQVVNENGQPLPHATVVLRGSLPQPQPRTTTADNEGNFQVTGLDPVLYSVSASLPSYITPPRDPDSDPIYHRVGDRVSFTLVKGGVISGTVLSSSSEPVVQIPVKAVMVRDANGKPPKFGAFQVMRTTDDRGMFRIYGLLPGTYVVLAGGRGTINGLTNAFDGDAPTYAPSATRDTATEITVKAGEEISAVDVRYRGEQGHIVSGFANGPAESSTGTVMSINLVQIFQGVPMSSAYTFQPLSIGFAFYGVADGEYDLIAQASVGQGEAYVSEARRIVVKGADVTGVELVAKPLGSISGRIALERSTTIECQNKRQPMLAETLIMARHNDKAAPKDQPRPSIFFYAQGSPDKAGDFQLRNLGPGQYNLKTRFYARYWYLRSVVRETAAAPAATVRSAPSKRLLDIARNGIKLQSGERLRDITITLAQGAGSLRGKIMRDTRESLPANLYVHLVPAEKENVENSLRYFAAEVQSDGTFALNNLPPGRYWTLARAADEPPTDSTARAPVETDILNQIRRAAEGAKIEIELKPCQNITNYELPLTLRSERN